MLNDLQWQSSMHTPPKLLLFYAVCRRRHAPRRCSGAVSAPLHIVYMEARNAGVTAAKDRPSLVIQTPRPTGGQHWCCMLGLWWCCGCERGRRIRQARTDASCELLLVCTLGTSAASLAVLVIPQPPNCGSLTSMSAISSWCSVTCRQGLCQRSSFRNPCCGWLLTLPSTAWETTALTMPHAHPDAGPQHRVLQAVSDWRFCERGCWGAIRDFGSNFSECFADLL